MASQTLVCSSTPKLTTFNNFRTTPPPSLALPSPRAFKSSASLPTLSLKPFNFGVKPLQTSDFKCYATATDEKDSITSVVHKNGAVAVWEDIKDVDQDEYVQALGQFAVDEENKNPEHEKTPINFLRVVEAERQVVAGLNYRLWIQGKVENADKVFKAFVSVGPPIFPKSLESFDPFPLKN